ncbi:MAG: sigma-70 family RNA polymerase sigma factor [Planctomycetes bacterium]|nr:sigma-70 family RNA polymerase sigma factor [Planctomycetota bacterium]
MAVSGKPSDQQGDELERALRDGDGSALAQLFDRERGRLHRMVQFRLDPRLVGRIDPEDVVQETWLEAEKRVAAFLADDKPFFLWVRLITQQTMVDLHRKHIGTKMRAAAREVQSPASSALSGFFVGHITSPSGAAMRAELRQRIEAALDSMDDIDREVLLLRHFEELSNKEAAAVLGIQENAASNRYVRALGRLKGLLSELADG